MTKRNPVSQRQKILIIEYYLIHKADGLKSIAMDLDISYAVLTKHVNDYKKTGFLVLKSKMN